MAAGRQVVELAQAEPRPRVRALHQLRDAEGGPGGWRNGARSFADAHAGDSSEVAVAADSSKRQLRPLRDGKLWQGVDVVETRSVA